MARRSISVDSRRVPSKVTMGIVMITKLTSVETKLVVTGMMVISGMLVVAHGMIGIKFIMKHIT